MKNTLMRNDTARHMKSVHNAVIHAKHLLLRGNEPCTCTCSNCELQLVSTPEVEHSAWMVIGSIVLAVLVLVVCWAGSAHAYTEEQAIKTIVGEASNQGYTGMLAVAEVIRHKTSLKGFYGLHAKHAAHEPKWVWIQVKKAWQASLRSDLTHGANHFENIHAFGCPYWVKRCVETFRYRDHVFYREIV